VCRVSVDDYSYAEKDRTDEVVELSTVRLAVLALVVGDDTGERGEIVLMGTKVLGALRDKDQWKSHASSASKYHHPMILSTAPVSSANTKPFGAEWESQWYNLCSNSFPSARWIRFYFRSLP
jgi:hypothetical protein